MEAIKTLDDKAEKEILDPAQWSNRYTMEKELEQIYAFEEIQWQKRGGEKWLLQGDANTGYFHGKANGRKKKCSIFSLEDGDKTITRDHELREHTERYYKNLFGPESNGGISVQEDFWDSHGRLSIEEAIELEKPFTVTENRASLKRDGF